jgi:hypothetical protein
MTRSPANDVTTSLRAAQAGDPEAAARLLPLCPACGGPLITFRGFWRCPRCCYSICESREDGVADNR